MIPAERWAHVSFTLKDGRRVTSEPAIARGNPENPLSDAEIEAKYFTLAEPVLGKERAAKIRTLVAQLPDADLTAFLDLLLSQVS